MTKRGQFFIHSLIFSTLAVLSKSWPIPVSVTSTNVNSGERIFCGRSSISKVRIGNCAAEPCKLVKGVALPVEVDFTFEAPQTGSRINLEVFLPFWTIPGERSTLEQKYGASGHTLASYVCGDHNEPSCPSHAGTAYMIKTNLYADPRLTQEATKIIGKGNPSLDTGVVNTGWILTITDGKDYSQCNFNVQFQF